MSKKYVNIKFEIIDEEGKRSYVEMRSFIDSEFLSKSESAIYKDLQAMVTASVRELKNPARAKEGSNL